MQTLYDIIEARNADLASKYQDKADGIPPLQFIPTGIPELDETGMGEPGILTGIMAHPGDGKTSIARMLLKGAVSAGFSPHGYFFEDPLELVADAYTSGVIGESAFKLRRLDLDSAKMPARLAAAMKEMEWSRQCFVDDKKIDSKILIEKLMDEVGLETGAFVVDYAQAFGSEGDESSVERVLAGLSWGLLNVCKAKKVAGYLMLQPKISDVTKRGDKQFESWKWRMEKEGKVTADPQSVYGYRPLEGDVQWSTAVWQRIKYALSAFRPGRWMRSRGLPAKDDVMEMLPIKGNYAPGQNLIKLRWRGETTEILSNRK